MSRGFLELGRRFLGGARALCRAGVDFVYPQACPFCGREEGQGGEIAEWYPVFCAECREHIAPEIPYSCERCAAPVGPHLDTSRGCIHCRNDRFAFEKVIRLGVYEGALRSACLRMKEPGGERLGAAMAGLLWERRREALGQAGIDLVVPVPHHWTQRLVRHQNPAATLARVLGRRLQVEWGAPILVKVRKTLAQASLLPTKRRVNLRGAFRARGGAALSGRTILLVDDILTTGTTAHEASKVLKRAGAQRVFIAVLARGIGRSAGGA